MLFAPRNLGMGDQFGGLFLACTEVDFSSEQLFQFFEIYKIYTHVYRSKLKRYENVDNLFDNMSNKSHQSSPNF